MIRGKLIHEERVPCLPGMNVSGSLARLKPGEKITVDLEVVLNKKEANASVDFVFLNTDLNFSGMFKARDFILKRANEEATLDSFTMNKKVVEDTSPEFFEWAQAGNIPYNIEFDRAKKLLEFKDLYPSFADDLYPRMFSRWITRYCKRYSYFHNPKVRGSKGISIIIAKNE